MGEKSATGFEKGEVDTIRSPLAWALLGLVIERPSHGYELAQRFKLIYGDALVLSSRMNIYRLLDTLKGHGLIEEVRDAGVSGAGVSGAGARSGEGRPRGGEQGSAGRAMHYQANAEGKRAYEDWLLFQLAQERNRQRLFARQVSMLAPQAALEVIARYEEEALNDPDEELTEEEKAIQSGGGVAERLAAEDERLTLEVKLSWLEYARTELKATLAERSKRR